MNIEEKLNKIEKELNKNKEKWIPKTYEEYWYYDKDAEIIDWHSWGDDKYDKTRLKNKVIFKTEAEAQRYADYQKAKEEYSYEFSKEEAEDVNKSKYYIYYNYYKKKIDIGANIHSKTLNTIYFKTQDLAREFIDKYKDEILEFEFGIKED